MPNLTKKEKKYWRSTNKKIAGDIKLLLQINPIYYGYVQINRDGIPSMPWGMTSLILLIWIGLLQRVLSLIEHIPSHQSVHQAGPAS